MLQLVRTGWMVLAVMLTISISNAQSCLDNNGQADYSSVISQYQKSEYKLISVKDVKMNSGKILSLIIELSPDFDYIMGLVCNSNIQATGVELRDNVGSLMDYDINYNAFKNNMTFLEFTEAGRKKYQVMVNAIDNDNGIICGKFFIMAKEKTDEKKLKKKTASF